jgi:hypothetical protein
MTILKSVMMATVLRAVGSSLAIAQNGPATGGEHPVAGGAAGGGWYGGWYGGAPYGNGWYGGAPGYGFGYPRLYNYYQPHRHRVRTVPPNH